MLPTTTSLSDICAGDRGRDGRRFWSQGSYRAVGGDAGGATETTWHQAVVQSGGPLELVSPKLWIPCGRLV